MAAMSEKVVIQHWIFRNRKEAACGAKTTEGFFGREYIVGPRPLYSPACRACLVIAALAEDEYLD